MIQREQKKQVIFSIGNVKLIQKCSYEHLHLATIIKIRQINGGRRQAEKSKNGQTYSGYEK